MKSRAPSAVSGAALWLAIGCQLHADRTSGGCGRGCSFEHGVGLCAEGACYLVACEEGFEDRDRQAENGCECSLTQGGEEICDGEDNDCDGVVDLKLAAPGYVSVCECADEELVLTEAGEDRDTAHGSCTTGSCGLGADNETPTMTFCCAQDGAWSQCRFLQADLGRFDADGEGQGVLEVVVELSAPVEGLGLSLWYGNFPRRKRLTLLDGKDTGVIGPGTISRYFVPEDAACPAYSAKDLEGDAFADFPEECAASPSWSCEGGRWASLDANCAFDYRASTVYITAENCSATVNATLSLLALRYYHDLGGCRCMAGSGCNDGRTCDMAADLPAPWCSENASRCSGICRPPASN